MPSVKIIEGMRKNATPSPLARPSRRASYDELIGCCDRVAILYDGRIVRVSQAVRMVEEHIEQTLAAPRRQPKSAL
jgi:hypothetical protein